MKISIAYLPEEKQKANNLLRFLHSFLGDNVDKVRESDRHAPFSHIYLTTRNPKKPRDAKKNP